MSELCPVHGSRLSGESTCIVCLWAEKLWPKKINELEAEVAALRKDKERLDWLIANTAWPMKDEDSGRGWFMAFYDSAPEYGFYPTAREAIDAAMIAEQAEHPLLEAQS